MITIAGAAVRLNQLVIVLERRANLLGNIHHIDELRYDLLTSRKKQHMFDQLELGIINALQATYGSDAKEFTKLATMGSLNKYGLSGVNTGMHYQAALSWLTNNVNKVSLAVDDKTLARLVSGEFVNHNLPNEILGRIVEKNKIPTPILLYRGAQQGQNALIYNLAIGNVNARQ